MELSSAQPKMRKQRTLYVTVKDFQKVRDQADFVDRGRQEADVGKGANSFFAKR